jgi:diphosphomevalonate decarboxylase
MAAQPALVYLEPATIACVHAVRRLRDEGKVAWATIDAGPHVKVITLPEQAAFVSDRLASVPGVLRTIVSRVGQDATVEVTEA